MTLHIAGGIYQESCLHPMWEAIYGSGGRAALAVSNLTDVQLHSYVYKDWAEDVKTLLMGSNITFAPTLSLCPIRFSYLHPLSPALVTPDRIIQQPSINVSGNAILRFSFIEGDAIVHGRKVVYDPQGNGVEQPFSANGSTAKELALVLNEQELKALGKSEDIGQAAHQAFLNSSASAIIAKLGPHGLKVFTPDGNSVFLPPFASSSVFKIGSGDVFSAVFAHQWAVEDLGLLAAAENASRAVCQFVAGHNLPITRDFALQNHCKAAFDISRTNNGKIYVAAPFFNLKHRWFVEEVVAVLSDLGAEVFSPLHEVGTALTHEEICNADYAAIEQCECMFASLDEKDPGTLAEVGYALALGKKVIIYTENLQSDDLVMFARANVKIFNDFTSSVYHSIWAAKK